VLLPWCLAYVCDVLALIDKHRGRFRRSLAATQRCHIGLLDDTRWQSRRPCCGARCAISHLRNVSIATAHRSRRQRRTTDCSAGSALNRHGYYCRSNTKTSVPRRRSCAACAQAKTACDNALPACARCAQRGLTCQYPRAATKRRDVAEARRPVVAHELNPDAANTIMPAVTDTLSLPTMTPAMDSDSPMLFTDAEWNFDDMTALDEYMHTSPQTFPSNASSSSPTSTDPTTVSPDATDALQVQSLAQEHLFNFSISPVPNPNIRTLVQRPRMHPGADRTASLLFYTLKSYPVMLRHNTLPPFIHPSYVSFTDEGTTTEPLENCITLMHMMASRVQGSRKLFWRNVRQECERICDQNQTLNKWELLGAMQALSIYVLIRLDEGETEHNNLDSLLERAVIVRRCTRAQLHH
jgi:hypothetical protein